MGPARGREWHARGARPMADLAQWREYLETQPGLGVPSLYYADLLESGERLTADDSEAIRRTWANWRASGRHAG